MSYPRPDIIWRGEIWQGQNSAKKAHPNDVVALFIINYSDICMKI